VKVTENHEKNFLRNTKKKFLDKLAVRSKERDEMRKKADEIVAKRLSESQIYI